MEAWKRVSRQTRGDAEIGDLGVQPVRGWLRLLALLLTWWEPLLFAVAAAGAFNAIAVRGVPVVLVLIGRLAATGVCVAGGRALLDARPIGIRLGVAGLALSAGAQLFAYLTPYYPSNRLPGQTPLYVGAVVVYYGGWLAYLARSKQATRLRSS